MNAGRRRTDLILLLGLVLTGWLLVSPAGAIAIAVAGVVVLAGIASVAAGHSRADDAAPPEATGTKSPEGARVQLPSLWTAFLVSFVVFALDFKAFFTGESALRYLFLLVPVGVFVVSARASQGRVSLRSADVALAALTVWGLAGALYGKFFAATVSSSLTMVLPMSIGLLHLWNRGRLTEAQCRRMLVFLSYIGFAYVLIYFAARFGFGPLSLAAYSKEKSFLLAIAPMAAFATRRNWMLAGELLALVAIFLEQPAATFVVVLAAVVVTNTLLSARSPAVKAAALAGLGISLYFGFSLAFASAHQSTLISTYFATVGKGDNTPFRLVLLEKGTAEVRRHPVLGTNFSGEVGIQTNFPGAARFAPAHNDFLQLAMAGGFVALTLYVYWIVSTNRLVQSRYRELRDRGSEQSARLLRVLVTGFNSFLFASLFNPLLAGVGIAVMFFLLYGSMSLLLVDHSLIRSVAIRPSVGSAADASG